MKSNKQNKIIKLEELTKEEKLKYEIAEELGLLDQVLNDGWKSLSSKETGRIGNFLQGRNGKHLKVTKILRILISMNIC